MNEKKVDYIRARKYPFGVLDIIVFAAAVALTVVLALTVVGEKGNAVEIAYESSRTVLPLSKDNEMRIGDCLTVVVSGGKVWVKDSSCKNLTCVKTGKISRVGETIVCAQNKIVITVIGNDGLAGSVGQG